MQADHHPQAADSRPITSDLADFIKQTQFQAQNGDNSSILNHSALRTQRRGDTPTTQADSPLDVSSSYPLGPRPLSKGGVAAPEEDCSAEARALSQSEETGSQVDLRRDLCDQNLFIFHLPSYWGESELSQIFSRFGPIISAKVVKRPDGTSKGYGFVCFQNHDDALVAVEAMNGYAVGGKRLKVSLKKTPEECLTMQVQKLMRMSEHADNFDRDRDCSLFVFHLPPHWDDRDLRDKFSAIVPLVAAKVSRKDDGTSRGYGFVTCADPRAAALAILRLNGVEVENKRLKVQPQQLGSAMHPKPDCTVFVFHLPNDWNDSILRKFFNHSGRIVSATVQRDARGRSRGFGFVTYDRSQAAKDAVAELDGISVGIKRLKVSLKRAPTSETLEMASPRRGGRGRFPQVTYDEDADDLISEDYEDDRNSDMGRTRAWERERSHYTDGGEFDNFVFDEAGTIHSDLMNTHPQVASRNAPPVSGSGLSPWACPAPEDRTTSADFYAQQQQFRGMLLNPLMQARAPPPVPSANEAAALNALQQNLISNALHQQMQAIAAARHQHPSLLPFQAPNFPPAQARLWQVPSSSIPYATTHPSLSAARSSPSNPQHFFAASQQQQQSQQGRR